MGTRLKSLHFLIVFASLLSACNLNRNQHPQYTSATVIPGPTSSVQAQPYPVATSIGPPIGQPYPVPTVKITRADETRMAYIASLDETITAVPTATPLPTFPADAPLCNASDLQISAFTEGFPTYLQFDVTIINVGKSVCSLQGPPDIKLVDRDGTMLDIGYSFHCITCNRFVPNLRALPFPTQTATAQQLLSSGIGVGPGEHVGVFMEWENWCQPFPEGGVELRLVFSDSLGFVKGPTNAYVGGPCRFSNDSSQIWVSQYFHTP
jgi:hypothetical protein